MKDKKLSYKKFIILSSPRSGTHMIRTTLRNHPNIVAHTELFNPDFLKNKPFDGQTSEEVILNQHIFKKYLKGIKAVGVIIHRSGTPWGNWPNLWQLLQEDEDIYVISLRRRNLLRRYLSYQVMRNFKKNTPKPLYFEPAILQADFEYQQQEIKQFDERFAKHPLLPVYYEDLCNDYTNTIQSVLQFLDLPTQQLWPDIEGKPKRKLKDAIENYDALYQHFRGTEWEHFFTENDEVKHIKKPKYVQWIEEKPFLFKLWKYFQ